MLKNPEKKQLKDFGRYSGLAFQMGFIIFAGAFGGLKLDAWLNWKFPFFTVVLTIGAVFLSVYQVFRDLMKPKS
jgi:hypothetical protein